MSIADYRSPDTPAAPQLRRAAPGREREHRDATVRRIRRTADQVGQSHPETEAAGHLQDAARMMQLGMHDSAKRHLDAAMELMTPRNLLRHGIQDDEGHATGKQAMHAIHRARLAVQDNEDMSRSNAQAAEHARLSRTAGEVSTPQALSAIKDPADPQAGGPRVGPAVMNAPRTTPVGRPDRAAAGPASPDRRGSKQISGSGGGSIRVAVQYSPDRRMGSRKVQGAAGLANDYDLAWIPHPSTVQWAEIDARTGHDPDDSSGGYVRSGTSGESATHLDDKAVESRFGQEAGDHIRGAAQAAQAGDREGVGRHMTAADSIISSHIAAQRPASAADVVQRNKDQGLLNNIRVINRRAGMGAQLAYEMSARTAMLEVTPAPRGRPGGPGLYDVSGMGHTAYLQQIVKALIEKRGMDPGRAYAIARGAIRKWMRGGGHVHPEVQAAAGRAEAGELERQGRAKAMHGHANETSLAEIDLAWDVVGALIDLVAGGPQWQGQQRVQKGQPGGGQFAKSGQSGTVPATQHKTGKRPPAHRRPPAGPHPAAGNRAARKAALLRKAAGLRAQIRSLLAQYHRLSAGSSRSARSASSTPRATGTAAAAAAAAKTAAATAAAAGKAGAATATTTSRTSSASMARSRQAAQVWQRIVTLRAELRATLAAAARL